MKNNETNEITKKRITQKNTIVEKYLKNSWLIHIIEEKERQKNGNT